MSAIVIFGGGRCLGANSGGGDVHAWIMAGQAPASSQGCYDPLRAAALQRAPRPAAPPAVHVDIIKAAFPASDA